MRYGDITYHDMSIMMTSTWMMTWGYHPWCSDGAIMTITRSCVLRSSNSCAVVIIAFVMACMDVRTSWFNNLKNLPTNAECCSMKNPHIHIQMGKQKEWNGNIWHALSYKGMGERQQTNKGTDGKGTDWKIMSHLSISLVSCHGLDVTRPHDMVFPHVDPMVVSLHTRLLSIMHSFIISRHISGNTPHHFFRYFCRG